MSRVYLETSVVTAMVKRDQSAEEMTALDWILENAQQHNLTLVTSRESIREIERTSDEQTRETLKSVYSRVKVVEDDHIVLGSSTYADQWTCITTPLVSDVVAKDVFDKLGTIRLKGSDQKHLMYAIHNKCDVFLTFDRNDFINRDRRAQIESSYTSIKVRTPKELRSGIDI